MEGARSPWSQTKSTYGGEKVGCIKGIEELYGIGTGSLWVNLNGDLGWQLPMAPQWPSNWGSGGKGKANRGCGQGPGLSIIGQDCPVCVSGWLGFSQSQARTCQGEASCSSCFPKTKETPCIAGSPVLGCWVCYCLITWPPTPALLFTPHGQGLSGSSFLFLILQQIHSLLYPEGKKRGELVLLPPYLSCSLPMEPSRTVLFKIIWHMVLLCIANMQHMPHVTSRLILKPFYTLFIEMSLLNMCLDVMAMPGRCKSFKILALNFYPYLIMG